jgi:translation initiation factor IF-2
MAEAKTTRLNKVLRELNISLDRAVEHLSKNGHDIEARPTTKISQEVYQVLLDGFQKDKTKKAASKEVGEEKRKEKEAIRVALEVKLEKKRSEEEAKKEVLKAKAKKLEIKTVGKIDIDTPKVSKLVEEPVVAKKVAQKPEVKTEKVEVEKAEVAKAIKVKKPVLKEKEEIKATENKRRKDRGSKNGSKRRKDS